MFDATDLGMPLLEGLDAIRSHMDKLPNHELGHHITNIYAETAGDEVILRSRIIAAGRANRCAVSAKPYDIASTALLLVSEERSYYIGRLMHPSGRVLIP